MRRLAHRLSFTLFPARCLLCRAPAGRQLDLCLACEQELPVMEQPCSVCGMALQPPHLICGPCLVSPPTFFRSYFGFAYAWPVDTMVNRFKHQGQLPLGSLLAHLLAGRYWSGNFYRLPAPQALVPVPLHPTRERQRGFNQAREIAEVVAAHTGIPLATGLIRRIRNTPAQQGLDRRQRHRNLKDAFAVTAPVAGARLALVDDVVTTSTTVSTISRLLLAAGADSVEVLALARTPGLQPS